MTAAARILEAENLPLTGHRLIEASAGTGKTYTIVQIYLRLLLESRLKPESILVVTFTVNATEELRERIRARIRAGIDALEGRGEADNLLQTILSRQPPEQSLILLRDAHARMDTAAVHTIHSFCQRILQEHALECAMPYAAHFLEQESQLRLEILRDFWRQRFATATGPEAGWLLSCWQRPEDLLAELEPALHQPDCRIVPAPRHEQRQSMEEEDLRLAGLLRDLWPRVRIEVAGLLASRQGLSKEKKHGYSEERTARALAAMEELTAGSGPLWLVPEEISLLSWDVMERLCLKKKEPVSHPFFHQMARYLEHHEILQRLRRTELLQIALHFLREELARRKHKRGELSFADLLSRLARALEHPGSGASLARSIKRRFPAALVDEFQDTDPCQYAIFRAIYAGPGQDSLLLIGDPKQAIYSFRGADLATYLEARRRTPQSGIFTMDRNFRASGGMVAAVNHLFSGERSFLDPKIRYPQVSAAAQVAALVIDGRRAAPLHLLPLRTGQPAAGRTSLAKESAAQEAARLCALKINQLLVLAGSGRALLGGNQLGAGDIAVLVRTHREASHIRKALSARRIASVYYGQETVFAGIAARALEQVLAAIIDPEKDTLVRRALLTPLFGQNGNQLQALAADVAAWESRLEQFRQYQETWRHSGPAAMLHHLLACEQSVARILAGADGERMLTDILHLGELLQGQESLLAGLEGQLRWLREQIRLPRLAASNAQLRLESDANLVRIITIHKAKGLEFPLVFLPFLWSARPVRPDEILCYHDPESGHALVDCGSNDPQALELAEKERLAEDLRLLYVALTRATSCSFFTWGTVNGMEQTAAHALFQGNSATIARLAAADGDDLPEKLMDLLKQGLLTVEKSIADAPVVPSPASPHALAPARFTGRIDTSWRITSFSRINAGKPEEATNSAWVQTPVPHPAQDTSRFSFPRGIEAGLLLHGLLEDCRFTDLASITGNGRIQRYLALHSIDPAWAPVLASWLREIVLTPCNPEGTLRLADLAPGDLLAETGFFFPLDLDLDAFNRHLLDHGYDGVEGEEHRLRGMMQGYIDLIFRHQGRYYLADYKSNHLGGSLADYSREALLPVMRKHRYDLQYLIYSVALHRHLAVRMEDYRYEKHFGGIYYLFLRGMHPECGCENGIFFTRPQKDCIDDLSRCCDGKRDHANLA